MCKLVVIDDNPTDHYIMQRLLHNNFNCEQATYTYDGRLVLDYIKENQDDNSHLPDVIFLDLDMPQLTGWEFLDELETMHLSKKSNMQVYIMSSSIRSADVFHSKKYACVNSFMTKPLSREVINKVCETASLQRDQRNSA